MATRLENLKQLMDESPDDPMPLYGMAMEYRNTGQLQASEDLFRTLRDRFPDYLPQYLMHGQVLEELGREDEARETYDQGLVKAQAQGEGHAESELREAFERVSP